MDLEKLKETLQSQKEWSRAAVFDLSGNVLVSTFDTDAKEFQSLVTVFKDRDTTIGEGVVLAGHHFDIHRFYERLVYGRRGDSERGEGIAFCKTSDTIAVITYTFPTISARAVPMLRDLCDEYLVSV